MRHAPLPEEIGVGDGAAANLADRSLRLRRPDVIRYVDDRSHFRGRLRTSSGSIISDEEWAVLE